MLDHRPIVQKTLIGSAAFAFVLFTLLAVSAFVLTGGFSFGGDRPVARSAQAVATVWRQTVADLTPDAWARPETPPLDEQVAMIPDGYDTGEALEGASDGSELYAALPSEEEIQRQIEREYATGADELRADDDADEYAQEDDVELDAEPYALPDDKKPTY